MSLQCHVRPFPKISPNGLKKKVLPGFLWVKITAITPNCPTVGGKGSLVSSVKCPKKEDRACG